MSSQRIGLHQIYAAPLAVPPANPLDWMIYMDDGSNTESGEKGWRQWNPDEGEWEDIGLQSVGDISIDGGAWT